MPKIKTSGTGTAKYFPDTLLIWLSIRESAENSEYAIIECGKKADKIKTNLSNKAKLINQDVYVSKKYNDRRLPIGYEANSRLVFECSDLNIIKDVMGKVIVPGCLIEGTKFMKKDMKDIKLKALEMATQDALDKAKFIAKSIKREFKDIEEITDISMNSGRFYKSEVAPGGIGGSGFNITPFDLEYSVEVGLVGIV